MNKLIFLIASVAIFFLPLQPYRIIAALPLSIDKILFLFLFLCFFLFYKSKIISNKIFYVLLTILGLLSISLLNFSFDGVIFYIFISIIFLVIDFTFKNGGMKYIYYSIVLSIVSIFLFGIYQLYFFSVYKQFPSTLPLSSLTIPNYSSHVLDKGGFIMGDGFFRLTLPFSRPQDYGFILGCYMFVLILFHNYLSTTWKKLNFLLILFSFIFLFLSGSRSVQFALFFSFLLSYSISLLRSLLSGVLKKSHVFLILLLFLFITAFLFLIPEETIGLLFNRILNSSYSGHILIRLEALDIFSSLNIFDLFTGVGFKSYIDHTSLGIYPHSHMTPLTILVESGIIGLSFFSFFIFLIYKKSMLYLNIYKSNYFYSLSVSSYFFFLLFSLLFYDFGFEYYWYLSAAIYLSFDTRFSSCD